MPFKRLVTALFLLPSLVLADELVISDSVIHETTRTARSGAGYFTITNTGDVADQLVGISADFPRVMMHQSEVNDGVATMTRVEVLAIPAGGTVDFAPGGFHIMFMGLNEPFVAGDRVPVTFSFDRAGEVTVEFEVISPEVEGHDHSQMDHS